MKVIQAGYTCQLCGANAFIEVRARAEGEGVENFVYHVSRMAGEDHSRRSPDCRAGVVDLKIPISKEGIGMPGAELSPEELKSLSDQCKDKGAGT